MAHYQVFACEVLFREFCYEASRSPNTIDIKFNRFGLHDIGSGKMAAELQALVDSVQDKSCDAVLFGYGLCNNGIVGLKAKSIPLVIPRAHDCITLLLGSKERYQQEFNKEPGTNYRSPGWIEHHHPLKAEEHVANKLGLGMPYKKMVELYGEENAKYLKATMANMDTHVKNYKRLLYVDTGLGPLNELTAISRQEAEKNNLKFKIIKGSRALIKKMLNGDWNTRDFLVVNPGQSIKPSYDNEILKTSS
ncbi:MAG: DUF1638 domain-containing protein [Candidatus Firestonebacteria bacterium]